MCYHKKKVQSKLKMFKESECWDLPQLPNTNKIILKCRNINKILAKNHPIDLAEVRVCLRNEIGSLKIFFFLLHLIREEENCHLPQNNNIAV